MQHPLHTCSLGPIIRGLTNESIMVIVESSKPDMGPSVKKREIQCLKIRDFQHVSGFAINRPDTHRFPFDNVCPSTSNTIRE